MTLGEKIQQCRKRLCMSQEDLGQKMLVSRQTVSLWEMDKNMPTVDNLVRLREIFGISLDELLTGELPEADDEKRDEAKERIEVEFSASELAEITKITRTQYLKNIIVTVLGCVICIFSIISDFSSSADNIYYCFYCMALGAFLIHGGAWLAKYVRYKKVWMKNHGGTQIERYVYEIFDDAFGVSFWRDGELRWQETVLFSDIERAEDYGKYYAFRVNDRSYWLKKEDLSADSRFHSVCGKKHDKKYTVSVVLNLISLLSPIVALYFGALIKVIFDTDYSAMGITYFVFTIIPISTLVYGIYLSKKGRRGRWNCAIGCVVLIILLFLGLSMFIGKRAGTKEDSPVLMAEKASGIDIPEYAHIKSQDVGGEEDAESLSEYASRLTYVYFSDSEADEFESRMMSDEKWSTSRELGDIVKIVSLHYYFSLRGYDYSVVCNLDTNEINRLPSEYGRYRFISIHYDIDLNEMLIIEYEHDYYE